MSQSLRTALASALLVLALAWPVLGLKLSIVGIHLEVQGASPAAQWAIAGAALAMFVWQLLRARLAGTALWLGTIAVFTAGHATAGNQARYRLPSLDCVNFRAETGPKALWTGAPPVK